MNQEITVELDHFKLTVEVTRLVNEAQDPTTTGERWVEFNVVYGIEYSEKDGRMIECGYLPWWLNKLQNDHHDAIEAEIWKQYEACQ